MSLFKKVITSIVLVSFIFASLSVPMANAQTWYFQEYTDWHQRVYDDLNPDEIFGERYTAAQVEWVIYGLFAFIINHVVGDDSIAACIMRSEGDPAGITPECITAIQDILTQIRQASVNPTPSLASVSPIQDILSGNRPLSGIGYVRNSLARFSLVQEVSAQGFGFGAANAMRDLWVAVRNISYFFLILLIIAMSFMIMFRFKISPQVVISVQSALPRVVGALLLITFSYAIAGFMIDLLYVVIGIIAAVLSQSGLYVYISGGNLSWADMYSGLAGVSFNVFTLMFFYFVSFVIVSIFALASNITGFFNLLTGGTEILWIIIVVIALIALLIILLKIIWMLIKTFVTVLLLVATGPIFILVGGFSGWLRNLASNLAVFAAVGPMFAISMLFLASALPDMGPLDDWIATILPFNPRADVMGSSSWIPPFLPSTGDLDVIWLFASFVIITLIPNVANIIKSIISGRPFGYGTAVGAALGAGAGVVWAPFGQQFAATRDAYMKERGAKIATSIAGGKYGQALKQFISR